MVKSEAKKHSNESGQVMAEFLFAIIVSFGLFMLFFAITLTFTAVEATQYVAFSVARAQAGSNKTADDQKKAAEDKYKAFMKNPALGAFFQSGWFVLGKKPTIKQGVALDSGVFSDLSADGGNFAKVFTGVSIAFESKLMAYKVLFINNGAQNDTGFKTNVNAILIRESSQEECQNFWKARYDALRTLPAGSSMKGAGSYYPVEDNGC